MNSAADAASAIVERHGRAALSNNARCTLPEASASVSGPPSPAQKARSGTRLNPSTSRYQRSDAARSDTKT